MVINYDKYKKQKSPYLMDPSRKMQDQYILFIKN